jgi:hypothetical protein
MCNYFDLASGVAKRGEAKSMGEAEISTLLDSMNIKVKKEQLKSLIKQADANRYHMTKKL